MAQTFDDTLILRPILSDFHALFAAEESGFEVPDISQAFFADIEIDGEKALMVIHPSKSAILFPQSGLDPAYLFEGEFQNLLALIGRGSIRATTTEYDLLDDTGWTKLW